MCVCYVSLHIAAYSFIIAMVLLPVTNSIRIDFHEQLVDLLSSLMFRIWPFLTDTHTHTMRSSTAIGVQITYFLVMYRYQILPMQIPMSILFFSLLPISLLILEINSVPIPILIHNFILICDIIELLLLNHKISIIIIQLKKI